VIRAARSLLLLAAVALIPACNADDDTTSPTTSAAVTVLVATTVDNTTPVTAARGTTDPPTTEPARTHPPTTAVTATPPSTVGPGVPSTTPATPPTSNDQATTAPLSEEDRVLALLAGSYEVWRECVQSVQTCDDAVFNDYLANPQLDGVRQNIAEWKANFYEVINVEALTYEVLDVDLQFTIPYVLICERNGSALVERRPGEPERIVDEGYVEQIREVQLTQVAGEWRIEGYATRERVEDQVGALCS
jgi:hypothetical protein